MVRHLLFALLLLGLGCGGMRDRADPPQAGTARIGYIANLQSLQTGYLYEQGARMAVAEINTAGGVNGQPLQLLVNVDRADSPSGLQGTRSLLDEGVVGFVGGPNSQLHTLMVALTAPRLVPLLSHNATSASLSTLSVPGLGPVSGTLSFRTVPSDALQGRFLAEKIWGSGIRSVGLLFRDDAYGTSLNQAFQDRYRALGGRLTTAVAYASNATEGYRERVQALLAAGLPEGILLASLSTDGVALCQHLKVLLPSPAPALFGPDGLTNPAFRSNAPADLVEGMRGSAPTAPVSAAFEAFSATYQAAVGQPAPNAAAFAYDAVYLLALALAAGGENTPQAAGHWLREVSGGLTPGGVPVTSRDFPQAVALLKAGGRVDYQGISGRIDLDARGDPTQATYAWWIIRKGAVEILDRTELRQDTRQEPSDVKRAGCSATASRELRLPSRIPSRRRG